MSTENSCREVLKNLCCNNGWCYGVFWRFHQENSLLLTLQDAYHEDQSGGLIDDMLLQVHVIGEGVIGRAAFTKKHAYIFSDIHYRNHTPQALAQDCKDDSEFYGQFSSGIKTIAVIPLEPLGVVQFGSFEKLPETMEFVHQTREIFRGLGKRGGLLLTETAFSSLHSEIFGCGDSFASLLSAKNPHIANSRYSYGIGEEDLIETTCSFTNLIQPFSSNSDHQMIDPVEFQVDFNGYIPNMQPQESFQKFGSYLDYSISGSCSCNTSQGLFLTTPSGSTSCSDTTKTGQKSSLSQFCSKDFFRDGDSTLLPYSGEIKHKGRTSLCTFEDFFQENDIAPALSKSCPLDNFSLLLPTMPDQSRDLISTTINYNLSHETGSTSISSYLNGHSHPCDSMQSSITNVFSCVEMEKCMDVSGSGKSFDSFEVDHGYKKSGQLDACTNKSKYISGASNKLFSSLGINQLMDDITSSSCSVVRSSIEYQLSSATKRRKIENSLQSGDHMKLTGLSNISSEHPLYSLERTNNPGSKSDAIQKLESGSLIGDSSSLNASSSYSQFKRHELPAKTLKKKAKPGTHPRPRDRQQIHDRLLELRELIPNGEKMSIDCLLHQTIKHLFFLRSVAEKAERIKQIGEPKNLTVLQDTLSSGECGVTWACEVGDETTVCPLIVEDLSTPGLMFIEIRCDEQGSFLEIVDIIRGFGLTILKGEMEACEAKICARFIVAAEGNRQVTRHQIFSSLIRLIQFTGSNVQNTTDQLSNMVNQGLVLFNTCQKSVVPLPVHIAETFHCTNLGQDTKKKC